MPNQDDHLRQLNAELDELRRSLVRIRAQLTLPAAQMRPGTAVEAMHQQISAIKTSVRLLQTDIANLRARMEQAEREVWDQKARRADVTAKFKDRERALEQIQHSASWKFIKPLWKLFNRRRKTSNDTTLNSDLAFALDLPKRWQTNRDILLIKGWCFSRSGKQIAGIRAKVGRKAKLARYGLERLDVYESFSHYPEARCSGFTVELKVSPGTSTIQLEAIEQGGEWHPFLARELERKSNGDTEEDLASPPEAPIERIVKLGPLSASNAFEVIRPGFQRHAARAGNRAPFISVLTPVHNSKPEWLAEAALSLIN